MSKPLLIASARDVSRRLGFYIDEAMRRPVGVTRRGVTDLVMISIEDYERLKRRDDREALVRPPRGAPHRQ